MAEPVLLISSDPFLGASLEALASGRIQVARLDPSRRPAAWPGEPAATVVLDVAARQRHALHAWIRRHHHGSLVVLLKPGERTPGVASDPASVVVGRPFRLADLVSVLEDPPPPLPADRVLPEPQDPDHQSPVLAAPGPAAPPRAASGPRPLPRPDWPTAATRLDGRRRRRRTRRGRRLATRLLVGLLVLLVLAGAWLALGLLDARRDLLVGAAAVRTELARAEAALEGGRPAEAGAAVQAAQRSLAVAATVPERRELRVAARLPVLSGGVRDTRHLLAAAGGLTGAGDRAVAVAGHLRAGRGALLGGGRFDLRAVSAATAQATELVAQLDLARGELAQVRGGPLAPGVDRTSRWTLGRLEEASARARPLLATLRALPAALGAGQPRTYLLVLTGPAERRSAGGVPLAAREVVLDRGVAATRPGGGELVAALRGAGDAPDFPTAGRAMLAAARSRGRPPPDAVVALDPLAVQALLAATGPVAVPGYGRLDAATAARRLTGAGADPAGRQRYLQAVLGATAARFLDGRDLVAVGRALAAAGAGRHLQAYATDPGLERLLASHRLDGGRG